MNIVCFGDSITHAAGAAEGDKWPTVVQKLLDAWRPGQYAVYNRGIGGHTSTQGLDRFGGDVKPLLPGLVLVEFGYNDANVYDHFKVPRVSVAEFRRNLAEIHRAVAALGGWTVFIVNHTFLPNEWLQGNGQRYYENFEPYNPAIRETAAALGAPTIDLPEIMARRSVDLETFLAQDRLHLTAKGNHTYADMVFEALRPLLEQRQA